MNEYEDIREEIDIYLMRRFKYRLSLAYLTPDNIVTTRRNNRVDLYLRIRKVESFFSPDCLIIVRIGFQKERIGMKYFIRFLSRITLKCGFKYIETKSYSIVFQIINAIPYLSVHKGIFEEQNVNNKLYGFRRKSPDLQFASYSIFCENITLSVLFIREAFYRLKTKNML